ncbi:flippase [Fusobacterium pseudoperiodonticum]
MNKILKNIGWLLFDKVFILILQFFIGVKIANYYGSDNFGMYNYAISIIAFSSILFELLNDRVIKKFFEDQKFSLVVFNVNIFRNFMAILILAFTIIVGFVLKLSALFYYTLIFLCIDNLLITSTQGIEIYFDYKLNSKNLVILNNIVKLLSYSLQYVFVILGYSILIIPIVRCLGSFIRLVILKYMYKVIYLKKEKIELNLNFILIKDIIKESFFLWLTFIGFLIYTQTDKIMLGSMLGNKEVGIYSIAGNLTQVLIILITPIQISIFPKMLELYRKNYKEYCRFYFNVNFIITQSYLFLSVLSIIVVKILFLKIFSTEYILSIPTYAILTVSVFFRANGALQTTHVTIKNITKKIFYKTMVGSVVNIILNYIFIKTYGVIGAALSTSIAHFLTLFVMDFFIKEYREQAWIQLKSLNPCYFKCVLRSIQITNKEGNEKL